MKILFIDASPTMLAKNLLPIANYIIVKKSISCHFVGLNLSSHVDSKIEEKSILLITNSGHKYLSSSYKKLESLIADLRPNIIFIGAYRIFDMLIIAFGKKYSIPTYKLQHGFEVESVYYKPSIIFSQIKKIMINIILLYKLSKFINSNYYILLYQYLSYFFFGKSLRFSRLNNSIFQPDKIFVYSEYYKEFWNKKFGLNRETMIIIDPPDFSLVSKLRGKERENACCYITQTLVEDGRMSIKKFRRTIIEPYYEMFKSIKTVYIKLHPRGNKSLYSKLSQLPNVKLVREFPYCSVYLTHYSSLVFTSLLLSNSVYLHELVGHPTPKIFKGVASYISENPQILGAKINENLTEEIPDLNTQVDKIGYFCSFTNSNPYAKIAAEILTQNNFIGNIE